MTRIRRIILVALMCVMPLTMANAEAPSGITKGTWYFSWSGIPFAKLWLYQEVTQDRLSFMASFKSRGILRLFDSMKTFCKGEGILSSTDAQTLSFIFENKDDGKYTELRFDADGALTKQVVIPPDDPTYRPLVPASALRGAVTPTTILATLAQGYHTMNATGRDRFSQLFYDGKRLMRVTARRGKDKQYSIEEQVHAVHTLILSRTPLQGFTPKELKRYDEKEPPAYLFLDQKTLWPIALEVEVKLGTMKAYWVAER